MMNRRTLMRAIVPATMILMTMLTRSARAMPMMSKKLVDYQDHPHGGARCASCCMFIPGHPARCTMIEGIISPNGWCKYFERGPADTCS